MVNNDNFNNSIFTRVNTSITKIISIIIVIIIVIVIIAIIYYYCYYYVCYRLATPDSLILDEGEKPGEEHNYYRSMHFFRYALTLSLHLYVEPLPASTRFT